MSDADCTLHNDCCDCFGISLGEPDPICKKLCDQPTCDALGIDQAVCRFGVCTTERVRCDPREVVCDAPTPDCPQGQVPGVTENGACWTGLCVPALSCDVVPECSDCPLGTMCVQLISQVDLLPTCEPIPHECNNFVHCDCVGPFACTGLFHLCAPGGGDKINCSCPDC